MRCNRLFLLSLIPVLAIRASAQRVWLTPGAGRNIGFDATYGFYSTTAEVGAASFLITAEGRFPIDAKTAITVALPFSRAVETDEFLSPSSRTSTAIGNPSIGLEAVVQRNLAIEVGIRPGLASDDPTKIGALVLGALSDFDRFEAWLPKVSSVRGMIHIGALPSHGSFVSGILGGTLAVPSGSSGGDKEFYANYGLRAGYLGSGALASVAFTGRANLTASDLTFSERTVHEVALSVEGIRGAFRPSVSVRTYLDDDVRKSMKAMATVGAAITM